MIILWFLRLWFLINIISSNFKSKNEVYAKYTNKEILNEVKVTSILDKTASYKSGWI
jgi:hypothetical protein